MNETLFLLHMAMAFLFTLGALKLGKGALTTWICLQALFANLFVLKQIELFGFQVTCSDVFAVGGILGLNLLQEYYGKPASQKATQACFFFMLFFVLLSKVHLLYIPSREDTAHEAYSQLLSPAPRLLLASLFVFFIVQKIDLKVFSKLKSKMKTSSFGLRNIISLLSSQLLDTVLFTFIGLYGIVSSLYDVILMSFLIKVVVILCLSPSAWVAKKFIPLKEIPI